MVHLSLKQRYFDAIKSGAKTVEGRINTAKFKGLTVGMSIHFTSVESGETMSCLVTALTVYGSFEEMLKAEGVAHMLPGVNTVDEGVKIYESFPGYKEGAKEVGALAIRIKRLSDS